MTKFRLATLACICAGIGVPGAHAQDPPYSLFQYSTLTGSGNAITATLVPVVTAKGTIYQNVTLLFDVSATGALTIASGYPQFSPVAPLIVSDFAAGKYVGPSTIDSGGLMVNVSGPGVTAGGATEWSLAAASGSSYYTYPASATWYVGPIASNPLYARLKAAGITSTAWNYGVAGSSCDCSQWQINTLIGVSQIGNTITFVSFTIGGETDYSTPRDQVTYTLAP